MTPPTERELTAPVSLCLPDGTLNPDAVGWSSRPLHACGLKLPFGRAKRWSFWCVTTRDHLLAVTYANVDYVGLATATFLSYPHGKVVEVSAVRPLGLGFSLPELVDGGPMRFESAGLRVEIVPGEGGTALRVESGRVTAEVWVELPEALPTLNVVVPWNPREFQFTSKHVGRPATGKATVDGKAYRFGPENEAFGCQDFGRGRWPRETRWNWASAAGLRDGALLGLNLGAQWTDGTGSTENALWLGNTLEKLSDPLRFTYDPGALARPWKITSGASSQVALTFVPRCTRTLGGFLGPLGARLHWGVGTFHGEVRRANGDRVVIDGLLGQAEDVHARW